MVGGLTVGRRIYLTDAEFAVLTQALYVEDGCDGLEHANAHSETPCDLNKLRMKFDLDTKPE